MDLKLLSIVFGTIFVAELGDKTQLATLLFAAKSPANLVAVFIGASVALIVASALGVLAGGFLSHLLSPKHLSYLAGVGFVTIGIWSFWHAYNFG